MLFFIKPTTVVLDCFTASASAMKFAKPVKAGRMIPEWWRELQDGAEIASTMKNCVGFTQLFASSIALPIWTDIDVTIRPDGVDWRCYDNETFAEIHAVAQRGSFAPPTEYQQLKIVSPWFFQEQTGVNFYVAGSPWNMANPFDYVITPGIVNFKHQFSTNLNLLFKREPQTVVKRLNLGDLGLLFVPMTEKKVKLQHHLVDDKEIRRFHQLAPVRKRAYFVNKAASGKCPFTGR